jgi:hypothetical protein
MTGEDAFRIYDPSFLPKKNFDLTIVDALGAEQPSDR